MEGATSVSPSLRSRKLWPGLAPDLVPHFQARAALAQRQHLPSGRGPRGEGAPQIGTGTTQKLEDADDPNKFLEEYQRGIPKEKYQTYIPKENIADWG